jgi:gliding motility-associated-like protein
MKLLPDRILALKVIFLILFLIQENVPGFGQIDEEPPVSPVLTLVTINPASGNTELSWTVSSSPDVAGYIIYLYQNGAGFALDTIWNPSSTNHSFYRPYSLIKSELFVVAAIDDSVNVSPLSNAICTVFNQVKIDTCNKKITVVWNKYPSYPSKVTGYDILRSVNGSAYSLAAQVPDSDTSFVTADFMNGTEYCFMIRAKLENGRTSASNKPCAVAKTQQVPLWINADYATVTPYDNVSLAFSIDPLSEIDLFSLERKVGSSGSFDQIAQIRTSIKSITYIDNEADPDKINYYRLSAVNSCGIKEISSNIASNIVLKAERGTGNDIILRWNSYYKWRGIISSYRLFMDKGSGFIQEAALEPADTIYSVNISDVMSNIAAGSICFYILAAEDSNPYGVAGESISNSSCFAVGETITVPNIFTPNGDLKNDRFAPVLTFTPADYHLIISDRHGRTVFETKDYTESWDGSDDNNSTREDVYLWFIKVRTNTGRSISKTGTVTIYNSK